MANPYVCFGKVSIIITIIKRKFILKIQVKRQGRNIKYQAEPANFSVDICFIRITNTINKHQINRKHFSVECR